MGIYTLIVERKATILLIRSHALYIKQGHVAAFSMWYARQVMYRRSLRTLTGVMRREIASGQWRP